MTLKIGKKSVEGKAKRTACLNCNGRTKKPGDLLCEVCNGGRPPSAAEKEFHSANRNKARYQPRAPRMPRTPQYHYTREDVPISLPHVSILEGQQ